LKKEKAKILMVDDDEHICRVMSLILEGEGFEVETAFTGENAIKKSKAKAYDAAILDIRLPDMEGTKVLKAMREISPKMVKIMLTGYPNLQNAVDSLNFGADAYLTKPPNPEDIINSIREKLQERKEEEQVTEEKISAFLKTSAARLLKDAAE
jgi:two-component system response regulator HydG